LAATVRHRLQGRFQSGAEAAVVKIEMGDFAGAVLKHLRRAPISQLSLAGGFGKISTLATGHLDLHSRHSSGDLVL
jgi:cobalt-precorrin-5B (C1)-methyltransferase